MANDFLHAVNLRKWNRNMLNAYWFLSAIAIVAQFVFVLFVDDELNYTLLFDKFLLPSTIIIGILVITELINHQMKHWNEYLLIVSGASIVSIILLIHTDIAGLYNILFLPILISAFYFQVRKVVFAFLVMVIILFSYTIVQLWLGTSVDVGNFISILTVLISGTVISIGITHRGIELLQQLQSTFDTKQDLLVKNIIMDRLSKIDALTELYNHITFHEYLDRLTEQSDLFHLPLQLAVIDIDNFKKVNDTYGHRAGDAVLIRVAHILQDCAKPNDFVARYGGEEFAILFTEKTLEESMSIMEEIRVRIAEAPNPELDDQSVTISGGLINYEKGFGKESFFRRADEALYTAKKSGKNRIVTK